MSLDVFRIDIDDRILLSENLYDRSNGNGAMMVTIAARLSAKEIEAVADYIAGLH